MLSDKEKLEELMLKLNLNQSQLAKLINIKQQVISRLLTAKDIKDSTATPALKYALLKHFYYDIDANTYTNKEKTQIKNTNSNVAVIPFYTAKASAGTGVSLPDYEESEVMHFDRRWVQNVIGVNPNNATIIQAKGDSMLPLISDGDLLMVDISIKEPIKGQIFVVQDDKQLFVKRVSKEWDGKWILLSENKEYPDVIPSKEAVVIGKVVWNGSKETV